MTGLTLFSGGGGVEIGLRHLVHFVGGVEYDPNIAAHAQAGTGGGNLNRAILTEPYRVVALTPRCLARFQSFPDDYELPTSKSLATKIIGNAVPCGLARAVFGAGMLEVAK